MRWCETDVLIEDIRRLADGTHHIVCLRFWSGVGEVDDAVVSVVEGWTYKVGKAGIDDDELLYSILLHVIDLGDEGAALTYDGTTQLEVNGLTGT